MKKITIIAFLAGALSFSMSASAQEVVNTGLLTGATTSIGMGTGDGECILLAENVTVNLSSGVNGAFRCSQAFGEARVGTCHVAGSRTGQTVTCAFTPSDEGQSQFGDPAVQGDWNGVGCADEESTFEISDRRYYSANSRGGRVTIASLDAGTGCSAQAVLGMFQ